MEARAEFGVSVGPSSASAPSAAGVSGANGRVPHRAYRCESRAYRRGWGDGIAVGVLRACSCDECARVSLLIRLARLKSDRVGRKGRRRALAGPREAAVSESLVITELFGGRRGGPLPAHDGRSDGRHGQKRADSTRLRHSPWMPAVDVATATSRRVLRAGSRNVHSNSKVPPTAQLCTAVSKNKNSWKFRLKVGRVRPADDVFIVDAAALAGNVHASSLTTHLATHRRIRARPAVRSCTPARGPPRTPGAPSPSSTIRQTWATAGGSARGQPP